MRRPVPRGPAHGIRLRPAPPPPWAGRDRRRGPPPPWPRRIFLTRGCDTPDGAGPAACTSVPPRRLPRRIRPAPAAPACASAAFAPRDLWRRGPRPWHCQPGRRPETRAEAHARRTNRGRPTPRLRPAGFHAAPAAPRRQPDAEPPCPGPMISGGRAHPRPHPPGLYRDGPHRSPEGARTGRMTAGSRAPRALAPRPSARLLRAGWHAENDPSRRPEIHRGARLAPRRTPRRSPGTGASRRQAA